MNELIKVSVNEKQEQLVSARELHEKLGIVKHFTDWFKYQTDKIGLIDNVDYILLHNIVEQNGSGGHNKTDYLVSIDIAKHLAMISGGEKAHEIRSYFIKIEKAWNDPELVMARSLQFAQRKLLSYEEKVQHLEARVEKDKPKVLFADAVSVSNTTILVGDLAKILKQNGVDIGANRLFAELRERGFLIKRKGTDWNKPAQKAMDLGLFEIKETVVNHSDGHTTVNTTSKVTGKGQVYFIDLFLSKQVS